MMIDKLKRRAEDYRQKARATDGHESAYYWSLALECEKHALSLEVQAVEV